MEVKVEPKRQKWLLYGHKGWLASHLQRWIAKSSHAIDLCFPTTRADCEEDVLNELNTHKPDRVISFVGRTSGPGFQTIDYLEQKGKLRENLNDNLFAPFVLMKLCNDKDIHCTYLGTGCIFSYVSETDNEFTTESKPNFFGSSYSVVKGFTDQIAKMYRETTLNVRIRMPISSTDEPGKSFLSKIMRYNKILSMLNSMTVIDDLFPLLICKIWDREVGTIHLTNPVPTNHADILDLFKKYVSPDHSYRSVSVEEHDRMLLAQRSNNVLRSSFPEAPSTLISVRNILRSDAFHQSLDVRSL